jgi:hypothetical protein
MIDPEKLDAQRRAVARLVGEKPAAPPRGKGRPVTCVCGKCRKCVKRRWLREARASNRVSPRICAVGGCKRHVHTADRCWRHNWQIKTWGFCLPSRLRAASPAEIARARAKLAARGIAA